MPLKTGRAAAVPPFIVMDIIKAANARDAARTAGRGEADAAGRTIHMEVGQPSTGAPRGVAEAAKRALDSGRALGYTEAMGIPALRAALAAHYRATYGLAIDPGRICVTVGASGAFPLAFLAAFDPGDRVALASPFYPPYVNILQALGLEPVLLEAAAESRFQPTVAQLEALSAGPDGPPAGLILASPCNPAGTMLHPDELAALARWCERRGVRLIADEIYHGLTYEAPADTALRHSASAIVVNSFSKYFSMTGWRLGWLVLPEDLVRPVECLTQNLFISAPTLSQEAALAAFDCHEELGANVRRYAENRALLLAELPRAGFERLAPAEGAFYLYADVTHLTNDSMEFCRRMLAEIGVAATPGLDFDRSRGNRFVRFSFAGSTAAVGSSAMPRAAPRTGPLPPPHLLAVPPHWRLGAELRLARRCYDHLAGVLGVALHDALLARGALRPAAPTQGRPPYALTAAGEALMARLGIDLPALRAGRRRLAWGCTDCSERRPHLAGALGAAVLARCVALGWVERGAARAACEAERRRVTVTPAGVGALREWIGLDWPPAQTCAAAVRHLGNRAGRRGARRRRAAR